MALHHPHRGGQGRRAQQEHYLSAQYARIRGRRGPNKAAVAVGHSILVIVWHMLTRSEVYTDLGANYFLERQRKEAYKRRLVAQVQRMGHEVTLQSIAA